MMLTHTSRFMAAGRQHRPGIPWLAALALLSGGISLAPAAAPTLLFEDNFNGGIPGWTAVQPPGAYIDGPLLWQYDAANQAFSELSNVYTDNANFSVTRIAPMLINSTVTGSSFTYTARLIAGDDDGFGLIWGYQNSDTFYRVSFGRQARAGWPFTGWAVDRLEGGQITDLAGAGMPGYVPTFINTATRPFDVTITVNNGVLSLSVVDNPLVTPTPFALVTGLTLPTAATGQVGIFSWGQSLLTPDGFQIKNPVLSPTPLTGDLSTVLSGWQFLITPRANGTTNMNAGGPPVWSIGVTTNGARGAMIENSDNFLDADNAAAGNNTYAAPTAVAGDVGWSNYVYSARITSDDDDGFGVMFRYVNETNFYRIAFRNQNSANGIKRGVSMQRNINRVFDQIFASTTFIPPIAVPMDVHVSMRDNRVQLLVISSPESAASQGFFFGPFDMTGSLLSTGKVGILSWAQYNGGTTGRAGTQVDFVKVQQLAGEGLIVASAFGTPNLPLGLNDFPLNSMITASVDSEVLSSPGVRRTCIGWNGSGSVPASGTANSVNVTLTSFSFIEWKWRTDYQFTRSASAGGQVTTAALEWVPSGTAVAVTATPDPGFIFIGWSGDSASSAPVLNFPMLRPVTLVAQFAPDSDADGLSDTWETQYFGNLAQTAGGDPDGDGAPNSNEFARGTNPNLAEVLAVTDGLSSQWLNTQRDPALPGRLGVVDFGSGYRGAFDNANDFRFGNDTTGTPVDWASFQSPCVVVRPELWNANWGTNFTASLEFTVGDNDGSCFYFRYVDETNWYRVTLCGEDPVGNTTRPRRGLSVQRRVNGTYSEIAAATDDVLYPDPLDTTGAKRIRLTVNATNSSFQIRSLPWNTTLPTPGFDPARERVVSFTDTSHAAGRIGFGLWGQGSFGRLTATNGIPVPSGALVDNIEVKVSDVPVFSENWEAATGTNGLPAGWSNPFAGPLAADWEVSAHGTVMQLSDAGGITTGSATRPKADADGPVLLAPNPCLTDYLLQVGVHPFNNNGIGLVYNFTDANNYSRVLFVSQAGGDGTMPLGLSVSRKSSGVWTDIVAGDPSFLYTPGRPFQISLAKSSTGARLQVWNLDTPGTVVTWQWTDGPGGTSKRFGLATWNQADGHFLSLRASSISPVVAPVAVADGFTTPQGRQLSIAAEKLLKNDSDPGGNPLRVVGVSPASMGGGTVSLASTRVIYNPPGGGFTGEDTFTYTISNYCGNLTTTNVIVMVADGNLPTLNQVSLETVPGGWRARFAGIPGFTYNIQRSPTLSPATWTTLTTSNAPIHGLMEYVDTSGLPTAFYRMVVSP